MQALEHLDALQPTAGDNCCQWHQAPLGLRGAVALTPPAFDADVVTDWLQAVGWWHCCHEHWLVMKVRQLSQPSKHRTTLHEKPQ